MLRALLLLSLAATSLTAMAQTDDDDATALSDVEVIGYKESATGPVAGYRARRSATATRTDAALDDIPVSVQVLSADLLADTASRDIASATRFVSGVTPADGASLIANREISLIRGFNQRAIYFNGFRLSATPTFDLAAVERLEVLKGPASILYGLVEPGGLINIVTQRPLDTPAASARAERRRFDARRYEFDWSLRPEGGGPRARLIGARETEDGFRDFTYLDREFAAPSVRVDFGERVSLQASYLRQDERRAFDEGVAFGVDGEPVAPITTYLGEPRLRGSDFDSDLVTAQLEVAASEALTLRFGLLDQRYAHRFEAFRPLGGPGEEPIPIPLLNQLAAANAIPGLGPLLVEVTDPVGPTEITRFYDDTGIRFDALQYRAEAVLDIAAFGLRHEILAGVDRREEESGVDEFRGLDLIGPDGLFPQKIDIINPVYGDAIPTQFTADGFAQGTQDFTGVYLQDRLRTLDERLNILLGLRYDRVESSQRALRASDQLFASVIPLQPPPQPSSVAPEDDALTWRVGALYRASASWSPYASVSTSFLPVDLFQQTQSGAQLEPETGIQYEIGSKFRFFDDRLDATLAVYRIDKEDVAVADPDGPPGTLVNGGELRSQGIEVDVVGSPLRGLELIFNYAFTDSLPLRSDVIPRDGSVKGVPRHAGGIAATYRILDGTLRGLGATVSYYASSERAGDTANRFDLPAYQLTDLGLSYRLRFGRTLFTPRVGVSNVFDETYYVGSNALSSVVPGAPRTWTASLAIDF